MNADLLARAGQLAKGPYRTVIKHDETTDGYPIYVVIHPELPGCIAQGDTVQDALENLADATFEYVLSLLEDNLSVPVPMQYASQTIALAVSPVIDAFKGHTEELFDKGVNNAIETKVAGTFEYYPPDRPISMSPLDELGFEKVEERVSV